LILFNNILKSNFVNKKSWKRLYCW